MIFRHPGSIARGTVCTALLMLAATAWGAAADPAAEEKTPLPDAAQALLDRGTQDIARERAKYDAASKKVADKLAADLKKEVEKATRAGNLKAALAVQERLDAVNRGDFSREIDERLSSGDLMGEGRPLRIEKCALPLGGKLTRERGDITLHGPGTGDVQNCVAVIPQAIPVGGSVRGTITANDKWCGFAIAASEAGDVYHSFYGEPGGTCSLFSHTGAKRTSVTTSSIPLQVPIGQPVKFIITHRAARSWEVTLGNATHKFDVASGGDCWGLTTYAGGSVTLRIE